jgi:hypothetical protein
VPGKARSTIVVCCHWKNKGWCRYQDKCNFAHPEHKRGVGMAKNPLDGRSSKKLGSIVEARSHLLAGQVMPVAPGQNMTCCPFMHPSVQPFLSQEGCRYQLVAASP